MKAILLVAGLVGLVLGCWYVYQYMYPGAAGEAAKKADLVYGGIAFAVALVCFAIFFFKRFREAGDQDISITKF